MKQLLLIIITSLFLQVYGQTSLVIGPTPLFDTPINTISADSLSNQLVLGDTVQILENTRQIVILQHLENFVFKRSYLFSTWAKVKTKQNEVGWIPKSYLTKTIFPQPKLVPGIIEGDITQDEIYIAGWNQNFVAYVIEGYIDGAVDGLTVRFYIKNLKNGVNEVEVTDHTGYDNPINAFWKQQGFNIQQLLKEYKITPITSDPEPIKTPIVIAQKDTIGFDYPYGENPAPIRCYYKNKSAIVHSITFYSRSMRSLRWIRNPYNKNQILWLVAHYTESTGHYLDPIGINLKNFR